MQKGHLLSPRQLRRELHVTQQTVSRWVRLGRLRPVARTLGGHARYDRADIEAIKLGKTSAARSLAPAVPLDNNLSAVSKLRAGAAYKLSPELERASVAAQDAEKVIEHLNVLRNKAVGELLGLSCPDLMLRLFTKPFGIVSKDLGIDSRALKRICSLYEVPMPPPGYWSTKPERRAIRLTPF